jgi:hypothetical protein
MKSLFHVSPPVKTLVFRVYDPLAYFSKSLANYLFALMMGHQLLISAPCNSARAPAVFIDDSIGRSDVGSLNIDTEGPPDITVLDTCVLDRSETALCSKRTIRGTGTAIASRTSRLLARHQYVFDGTRRSCVAHRVNLASPSPGPQLLSRNCQSTAVAVLCRTPIQKSCSHYRGNE